MNKLVSTFKGSHGRNGHQHTVVGRLCIKKPFSVSDNVCPSSFSIILVFVLIFTTFTLHKVFLIPVRQWALPHPK